MQGKIVGLISYKLELNSRNERRFERGERYYGKTNYSISKKCRENNK